MTPIQISLPEQVYRLKKKAEGENYQITFRGDTAHLWLIAQAHPPEFTEFEIESDSVPGSLPVACCATQWDTRTNGPTYNQTVMIDLLSVQRRPGRVRVRVRVSRGEIGRSHIAIGCIFALPDEK